MSDNIPSTTLPRKRSRRKYDKTKLPTPPPDPTEKESEKDDFLAYLDSLQKSNLYSRSTSTFTPIIATEDAFDHLEKLYKLMEQMLELREQNARLHRRVRDLEHLNNLEKMRKELDVGDDCPELDKDTAFAETILESILSETKSPKQKISAPSRLRQSISRKGRTRSGSVTVAGLEQEVRGDRRASTCVDSRAKPAKVSKWTKVKAAFKWEKAAPNVSDAKSQDSGIGGMVPVEVARYLRVPSCDDHGHSPVDSGAAEASTPASLSTASSTEDFHRHDQRSPCEDFRSSDDEHSHNYIPHSKEGSQKSHKSHKTPWAKMKDIIQTRNSFKKKHRLSAHSDDIQIDVELCSDNEDNVFEDEEKKSPKNYARMDSNDLPPEVVARYQQAIAEDSDLKKVSKWTRVKKAFLPPPDSVQDTVEDEIQRNYKQLQKKLSLEFQEKLTEWERMKQSSPGTSNPSSSCGYIEETKDSAFMKKMEEWQKIKSQPSVKRSIQMTSEENLPPEFRKKLQEWEKMRKLSCPKKKLSEVPRWKSLSAPKSETSPTIEYPPLSEDFRKKLEEWKQIKSGATPEAKSSPKLTRKESSPKHSKKHKDPHDKELQWFEKELGKIEKEKQRLERERQKFLEREESLSKLRSSVLGGLKKEVLIHTPSGFYRFEGISRKFTQKLYEWEKAQGIGPESSTFALLNSSLNRKTSPKHKTPDGTPPLVRSKSADSIAISALNLTCPLMSHQPSSLSLNDVEELEKEVLAESKSSSLQFVEDEPEALIVEVEDIVEETAAPLPTYSQRIQQPVYQREELKTMCEGETCAAPKVRRSESAKAQNNYNLIEEIFSILKNLIENELEIQRTQELMSEQETKANSDLIRLKMFDESQKAMSGRLNDKIQRLQEANSSVFASITRDESEMRQVVETLETVQDLSSEINQLTERLDSELTNRNVYEAFRECGARSLNPIIETAKDIKTKILELRRRLSYICAASDLTAPRRKFSKKLVKKSTSNESNTGSEGRLYVKSDTCNTQSQGAIKKRIRYRQKSQQNRNLADTDDEEDEVQKNTHKKLTRTRSVSESSGAKKETVVVDESIIQKVVVPTQTNFLDISSLDEEAKPSDSPVTVFVKTTRKLFTPLVESGLSREPDETKDNSSERSSTPVTHLPPVSPAPQRKLLKDISPSIRIMMDKYNQKISESPATKSGKSSGSASPVAWRSPTAERRVKAQTERYQEELKKSTPVQKSASASFLHRQLPTPKTAPSAIAKSSSVATFAKNEHLEAKRLSAELRLQKLQKAKEEFLNSGPTSAPPQVSEEAIKFPARNRLSQISVDSESSYDSACGTLIKSASAGMINVDALVYRQIDPEVHGGGYVSLPRSTKKQKGLLGGKFGFSNIASKFRKVKMRKGKEKMNAVSTLCRQSLVVDIQPQLAEGKGGEEGKETSPGTSRSNSWIKKPKFFKK
ncbi:uncharacterized protein LOC659628 [Tribolium castaneum]|uniref:uncharacterized protein LOC659628 n=1 Tax=Tribolium castaneum TaxID=7070 RepID=UPI00046C30F2|nr:PREDICTED: uncharacterized protein LOC659628 [Tribolium castaneum]|eukprot:XP_008198722.1 PREDICTED: uncharacterized protein LOC659628 [Tribolium castaneum]